MSTGQVQKAVENANQTAIASRLNVSRNYVCLVFNKRRIPTLTMAAQMAKELGVSLEEFYGFVASPSVN